MKMSRDPEHVHTKFEVPSFTQSKDMTGSPQFNKCSAVVEIIIIIIIIIIQHLYSALKVL